jgi:hypothetical protein
MEGGTFKTSGVILVLATGFYVFWRGFFTVGKGICQMVTGIIVLRQGIFT